MVRVAKLPLSTLLSAALVLSLCMAFGRAHLRIQTTMIGYELGKLKSDEASLLEKRSHLQMELAKLTTKKELLNFANRKRETHTAGAYASF